VGRILSLRNNSREVRKQVAQVLLDECVVCLPSDTCYGLTALATSESATLRLKRLKWRDEDKPFILLIPSTDDAKNYVVEWSAKADLLARCFWPGPLTMVLDFKRKTKPRVHHSNPGIALRLPDDEFLTSLMVDLSSPVWSTSANSPGGEAPAGIDNIPSEILRAVDLVIDGGPLPSPAPSTIIRLSGEEVVIVRRGPVKREDIMAKTGVNVRDSTFDS